MKKKNARDSILTGVRQRDGFSLADDEAGPGPGS
jgi:hypothetical protein